MLCCDTISEPPTTAHSALTRVPPQKANSVLPASHLLLEEVVARVLLAWCS